MLSGIITIRDRKLPLTWTGETAQHLADMHYSGVNTEAGSHPFLHLDAQKFARLGQVFKKKDRVYLSICKALSGGWVIIPLLISGKFVVIRSCYVENHLTFDTVKKQKGVGTSTTVKKIKPADINLSQPTIDAGESVGISANDVKSAIADYINGKQPLNKKR